MKIVQINATLGIGSTGRIVSELAEYIEKSGNTAISLFAQGQKENPSDRRIGCTAGQRAHLLASLFLGNQGFHSRLSTKRLVRYLSDIRPDIVHLHNLHSNYIHLPVLGNYLAQADIPTVITLHDCWFFTGKCCHYTASGCEKWQNGCGHCPRVHMDNKSLFFDKSAEMYQKKKRILGSIPRLAVVGVSDWITGEAKKSYLSSAKILKTVYNGIDLQIFCQHSSSIKERFALSAKKLILGVAAFWNPDKGHDDFCRLAELLDDDYVILLVGQPPVSKRSEKILYIGAVSRPDELAHFYNAADIFVSLSREESFGKVIAEALACGTPVAAYDATAIGELVPSGCGALAAPGDVGEIVRIIQAVTSHEKESFSQNCVDFSRQFDRNLCGKKYLDIYQQLSE